MSDIPALFVANILPILLVASAGFLLQRTINLDPQPLSQVLFYVLAPSLVFQLLADSSIPGADLLRMAIHAILIILVICGVSWLLALMIRVPPRLTSAFILSAAFMNAGNYGLPLNQLAFGDSALAWASIFFVASALMTNSLGVFVASLGSRTPLDAVKGLAKVPSIYSIPLAILARSTSITIPTFIYHPIELLASASIPVMLLLLGVQIAKSGLPKERGLLALAVTLRLVVSPLVAWALAPALSLPLIAQKAAIIEAAMPTAVFTTVIATQYRLEPRFVTGTVLVSTLLSPLTVTPLLALLGA